MTTDKQFDKLNRLTQIQSDTGFQHCLMRNHFHLVVETPDANQVAGMAWLLSEYIIRMNHPKVLEVDCFKSTSALMVGTQRAYPSSRIVLQRLERI